MIHYIEIGFILSTGYLQLIFIESRMYFSMILSIMNCWPAIQLDFFDKSHYVWTSWVDWRIGSGTIIDNDYSSKVRVQSSIKVYGLWHSQKQYFKISLRVAVSSIKTVVIQFNVKNPILNAEGLFFHVFWFWWNLKFFRISKYKSDCGPIKWSYKSDKSKITFLRKLTAKLSRMDRKCVD